MIITETIHLAASYSATRNKTVSLCGPLREEDTVVQPIVDVSPPKWHLGHSTWFFENFILSRFKKDYKHFNKSWNYIFNSYYESQGERILRTNRGNLTRPSFSEIITYRKYVDEQMQELLVDEAIALKIQNWVILGLQHEMQHQELLVTDIKYILGNNPLFPIYKEQDIEFGAMPNTTGEDFLEIGEGVYEIGFKGDAFHYDNETGYHKAFLHAYRIMDRLITNAEFLKFIEAGGYEQYQFWLSEGWEWVKKHRVKAPLYWFKMDGCWHNYTLSGFQKVDLSAPVTHVSFFEADAFARWKEMRLPTEFEWETACKLFSPEIPQNANLLETEKYSPIPRTKNDFQFYGEVWEWTNSSYLPYPYYKQDKGALGEYNGKFMINQMVLKGGSCATPYPQIRASYRNFFQTDKQWQFSGIRLAQYL
ncbi:MAG: ergothioneine biosynthesis protein EgtB [Flammeovirgaceae bacterium]|nr:ergothioneine biosynthesis protein EgtB [Flammeovirgaceae bacterium]